MSVPSIPSICVAEVIDIGTGRILTSFSALTEQQARRAAHLYCRNTRRFGAKVRVYWNLSASDL